MRRVALSSILAITLAFCGITLSAESRPVLSGVAAGIELCPQFICGFALFVGNFQGEVNGKDASGHFAATITHEPLPGVLQTADVTGGQWTITANRRVLSGNVTDGTILNLNGLQFCVTMELTINGSGRGQLYFTGLLDHTPFPPTIAGFVTQNPLPCSALTTLQAD